MSEEDANKLEDVSRRSFLGEVTAAVAGIGLAASCVPFIESMSPSTNVLSAATTEVDLKTIDLGKVKTVPWEGKPIFVMHRTDEKSWQWRLPWAVSTRRPMQNASRNRSG